MTCTSDDTFSAATLRMNAAKDAVAQLEGRREALASELARARENEATARKRRAAANGAHCLGELSEAEAVKARKVHQDAESHLEGLESAIETLARRLTEARKGVVAAEIELMRFAADEAAAIEPTLRARVAELADELGATMSRWSKVHNLARQNSGFITGMAQVNMLGSVRDILRRHRVDCESEIYVRHLEHRDELKAHEIASLRD